MFLIHWINKITKSEQETLNSEQLTVSTPPKTSETTKSTILTQTVVQKPHPIHPKTVVFNKITNYPKKCSKVISKYQVELNKPTKLKIGSIQIIA